MKFWIHGGAYKDEPEIWVARPLLSFCLARPIRAVQNFLASPLMQKNVFWPVLICAPCKTVIFTTKISDCNLKKNVIFSIKYFLKSKDFLTTCWKTIRRLPDIFSCTRRKRLPKQWASFWKLIMFTRRNSDIQIRVFASFIFFSY